MELEPMWKKTNQPLKSSQRSRTRCGEVFVSNFDSFSFECSVCGTEFYKVDLFLQHIKGHLVLSRHKEIAASGTIVEFADPICTINIDLVDVPNEGESKDETWTSSGSDDEWATKENEELDEFTEFIPDSLLDNIEEFIDSHAETNVKDNSVHEKNTDMKSRRDVHEEQHCSKHEEGSVQQERISSKCGYGEDFVEVLDEEDIRIDVVEEVVEVVNLGSTENENESSVCELEGRCDPPNPSQTTEDFSDPKVVGDQPALKRRLRMICALCSEPVAHLRKHMKQSHGIENMGRIYQCNECEKSFPTKNRLDRHRFVHSTERPWKCTICGFAFALKSRLDTHLLRHNKIKQFSCEHCDKQFYTSSERDTHTLTHTNFKPFVCEICGLGCTTSSAYNVHKKRHLGIREFECTECGKAFHTRSSLKQHHNLHTDNRPYKCKLCPAMFHRINARSQHMTKHKKEIAKKLVHLESK